MAEEGIDITTQRPKNVVEWFKEHFAYVITLADMAKERSPVFPFTPHLLHWSLRDPSLVEGSQEEKKRAFRQVRDEIKASVGQFVEETATAFRPFESFTRAIYTRTIAES